jgi:hypothetical protein
MSTAAAATASALHAAWTRTPQGWALNLDGSAASKFALPRLEIEQSPKGWLCRCRFGDGSTREQLDDAGSIHVAQRTAAQLARGRVEGPYGAAVDALLR